jgi:hypothetical protein
MKSRSNYDTVAERLRRLTRNQLGLSRVGSSPAGVALFLLSFHPLFHEHWFFLHPFLFCRSFSFLFCSQYRIYVLISGSRISTEVSGTIFRLRLHVSFAFRFHYFPSKLVELIVSSLLFHLMK